MKFKQNIIAFLLGMLVTLPMGAYGATLIVKAVDTPILVDGKQIDTAAYSVNNKTCAAVDAVAEAMGGTMTSKDGKLLIEKPKTDLEKVAATCKDSCTLITVFQDGNQVGQASGFIYGNYVITARHVTDAGTSYKVYPDGDVYGTAATRVDVVSDYDIGVLRMPNGLPSVKLGDSSLLKEGQKVFGITCPNGNFNIIDECTASGIVKYVDGTCIELGDTSMEGGSSGGAIFNYAGELVGIVIKGDENSNMSAIPINEVKSIIKNLK